MKYIRILQNYRLVLFFKFINIPAFLLSLFISFLPFGLLIILNPIFFFMIIAFINGSIGYFLIYKKLKMIDSIIL
jgi:hypothetical protein